MKNIKTYEEFEEGVTFDQFLSLYLRYGNIISSILDCSDRKLIDLNGIEQFNNLERLSCCSNKLTSLEPIKNLTKIYRLRFSYNNISDLSFIEKLTNITYLCFHYNKITSLKGIENLINLSVLRCCDNDIDWVDYIDKKGNTWYIVLPKSITYFQCDKFKTYEEYLKFMDENQPSNVSRKFNF